jgi:aminoglycoside phosphotransferase (APT) family kinase protein
VTPTPQPARLLASGRDSDIYEHGAGSVLRRAKDGRSIEHEARVMEYARAQGYPVPAVREVRGGGSEIVMERVEGPLMLDAVLRRPWTIPANATLLAELHDRLHRIAAPEWLPELSDGGDRLLHLDLHPSNVMLSARGPVVVDWSNAARGEALSDVAMTYVLLTCPRMPAPAIVGALARPGRALLARVFARRYRGLALDQRIAAMAELKALDPNMRPDETAACRRLARRARRRAERALL